MENKHEIVKKAYGDIARRQTSCCCDSSCCDSTNPFSISDHPVPESDLGLSCGNPLAFGHIKPGDTVADLGSGAGKDVFLAARIVGATGKVIGIDMTADMLALARRNAEQYRQATGMSNVEFCEGTIEEMPLDDASVDVVISNCVINLSPDKPGVFREISRVLKPGGCMIVSDLVLEKPLPTEKLDDDNLYTGCIGGAILRTEYLQAIRDAGLTQLEILDDREWETDDGDIAAASVTVKAIK